MTRNGATNCAPTRLRLIVLQSQLGADVPAKRALHSSRIVAALLFQEAFMNEQTNFRFVLSGCSRSSSHCGVAHDAYACARLRGRAVCWFW